MLRRSVEIACEARDLYHERSAVCSLGDDTHGRILKQRPILIAASVGSYGAYLADGSEYRWNEQDLWYLEASVFFLLPTCVFEYISHLIYYAVHLLINNQNDVNLW